MGLHYRTGSENTKRFNNTKRYNLLTSTTKVRLESVSPDLGTRRVSCPGRGGQAPAVSCCPRQQPLQHSLPLTHSPQDQHWFPLQVSPRSGQCGCEPCSEGFQHPKEMESSSHTSTKNDPVLKLSFYKTDSHLYHYINIFTVDKSFQVSLHL